MSNQFENRDYSTIQFYLSPSFMREKTAFQNLNAFLENCGIAFDSQASFDAIPPEHLDLLIKQNTPFDNVDALMSAALDYSFESQLKQIKF
ncbi:MAG: hypothetical protein PWP62_749 [Eubacteriaceae bacterium]|nr:hypothetical protein [Eubacteriaceae bacterium]